MAFPLAAIGAGLGQYAEFMQRQKQAEMQRAYAELALRKERMLEQQQQEEKQALGAAWGGLLPQGGFTPAGPTGGANPLGLSGPGGMSMPAPQPRVIAPPRPAAPSTDDLGAFPESGNPPSASGDGSDVDAALAPIIQRESGGKPYVGYGGADLSAAPLNETGFPQWSGKMGPQGISHAAGLYQIQPGKWAPIAKRLGITDFSPESQRAVASELYRTEGEKPWAASAPAGGGGGGAPSGGIGSIALPLADAAKTAIETRLSVDPKAMGRLSIPQLAQQIEQANPGAPPAVKMMALQFAAKALAPEQQMQLRLMMAENSANIRVALAEFQAQQANQRAGERKWQFITLADGTIVRANATTGEAEPTEMKGKTAAGKTSRNVEVTDSEGKTVFRGSAHQSPEGWVADKDQKPVPIPDGGNIKLLGTGEGRQAAAQIQSMIGSTAEVVGEARNLMALPATSVAGIFQGLQSIPADKMGDALKRTLANKLTPEESTDLTTSFQGVARALATIEGQGRATGLVGLTKLSAGLMPQTGDTVGNMLRKYATIRQIVERNTEAIEASPSIGAEQKALLKKLKGELEDAIPFTVAEVNKWQHGDTESVTGMAKRLGIGKGAAAPPEAVADLKRDPSPARQKQFDEVFGPGAAAKALGK
jgi:hypothetical protein